MKNAIVTGATRGIGLATAEMLLQEGYHVAVTYAYDEESVAPCKERLSKVSDAFEILWVDQTSKQEMHDFAMKMRKKEHIDCIVCNAGMTLRKGLKDIDEVVATLNEGGVALGASGPRVRTVTACQGGRVCPSGRIDAFEIAEELDKRYYGRNLPHKFKFGVTGCPNNCLKAEENDLGVKGVTETRWEPTKCVYCGACQRACAKRHAIRVELDSWTVDAERCNHCGKCVDACRKGALLGRNGYQLTFGGAFGATVRYGRAATPIIFDKETLFRVVDATVEYFERNAAPKERLAATIERRGGDEFQTTILAAYDRDDA